MSCQRVGAQLARKSRGLILDAATCKFVLNGNQKTTIKDIAEPAEISDATIYNLFTYNAILIAGLLDRVNGTEDRE